MLVLGIATAPAGKPEELFGPRAGFRYAERGGRLHAPSFSPRRGGIRRRVSVLQTSHAVGSRQHPASPLQRGGRERRAQSIEKAQAQAVSRGFHGEATSLCVHLPTLGGGRNFGRTPTSRVLRTFDGLSWPGRIRRAQDPPRSSADAHLPRPLRRAAGR